MDNTKNVPKRLTERGTLDNQRTKGFFLTKERLTINSTKSNPTIKFTG